MAVVQGEHVLNQPLPHGRRSVEGSSAGLPPLSADNFFDPSPLAISGRVPL